MKFSITNNGDYLIIHYNQRKLLEVSALLNYSDTSTEEEIINIIEQLPNLNENQTERDDIVVWISEKYSKVINHNNDDIENHTDTLPTKDLLEIVKEVIKIKEARKPA